MTHIQQRRIYIGSTGDPQNKNEKQLAILDDTRVYQYYNTRVQRDAARNHLRIVIVPSTYLRLEQTPPYRVDIKHIYVVV